MKTIALNEQTFNLIRDIKERENVASFDKLILDLILKKEGVDDSLFGSLKNKTKSFSSNERKGLWQDTNR